MEAGWTERGKPPRPSLRLKRWCLPPGHAGDGGHSGCFTSSHNFVHKSLQPVLTWATRSNNRFRCTRQRHPRARAGSCPRGEYGGDPRALRWPASVCPEQARVASRLPSYRNVSWVPAAFPRIGATDARRGDDVKGVAVIPAPERTLVHEGGGRGDRMRCGCCCASPKAKPHRTAPHAATPAIVGTRAGGGVCGSVRFARAHHTLRRPGGQRPPGPPAHPQPRPELAADVRM
jgi:hypothetical protein